LVFVRDFRRAVRFARDVDPWATPAFVVRDAWMALVLLGDERRALGVVVVVGY